ncbi:MAG: peptidoglycan-binding protein [Eubacteriales bacterium]
MTEGNLLPVIPETITVHLGAPDEDAPNVTVSFPDYIKNVASSEIYPTWPESAIRANILAQISFALNRIYTEYYRSRGYDFDITNSTARDQSFVLGRDIFENISQIVDDIFNDYLRREGSVEPLFAQYCNGTSVTCEGLSQWGTVELAEQGYTPFEILQYYFGDDIELVRDAPITGITESYPGIALRPGTTGNDIRRIQVRLNRIASNYPSIPKIQNPDGIYGPETEAAVREFQKIFSLTQDGIIGRATWYMIQRVYNAVKRLNELNSEGLPLEDIANLRVTQLAEGDTGPSVRELQYLLSFVSNFVDTIPPVSLDGIFGPQTRNAVEAFQQTYGLPVTGIVDTVTWNRLYNTFRGQYASLPENYFAGPTLPYPGVPQRLGSSGEDVMHLQEYLNYIANTYDTIPKVNADGVFGPQTTEAVRAFQTLFGIEPSGVVGAATWDAITSAYAELYKGAQASGIQYGGDIS